VVVHDQETCRPETAVQGSLECVPAEAICTYELIGGKSGGLPHQESCRPVEKRDCRKHGNSDVEARLTSPKIP
jgi:hypothetical protein